MDAPDQAGTSNAAKGPVHEWRIKPSPPRVFSTACLDLYYRARHGGWFKLLFTTHTKYLAHRVIECPPEAKIHYGLDPNLVEACRGLDLLPKEEES